ncbi:hypothetical protein T4D_3459 [Trichinella pseudospiralis]|uniref:Uncharacterized protein n=1 Tax=Trichinella pseudospiralis TaxID=6337 RepID=A0A0V1F9E7_TRIPS|nr:hypothetical protein T4D_3459 [Trichinella pseudospiralis]
MNGHHCQLENSYKRTNINYICPDIAEKCHKRTAFLFAEQSNLSFRIEKTGKKFSASSVGVALPQMFINICRTDCAEFETLHQLTPHQCGGCDASIVLRCLSIELQAILQQSNQQQHCIEKFE